MTLESLLRELNHYHKRHGVTILYNEPKSIWVRIKDQSLKVVTGIFCVMVLLSCSKTFSNNDTVNRIVNFIGSVLISEILSNETLFWLRRHKALRLVNWCRHIETHQVSVFYKPNDWFSKTRKEVRIIVR